MAWRLAAKLQSSGAEEQARARHADYYFTLTLDTERSWFTEQEQASFESIDADIHSLKVVSPAVGSDPGAFAAFGV